MIKKNDWFVTIGNTDFRITKSGQIQARVHETGTAIIKSGFQVQSGKKIIQLKSDFTTTSSVWVDVTGLDLGETEYSKLKEFLSYLDKNKSFLLRLIRFGFDFGFGVD